MRLSGFKPAKPGEPSCATCAHGSQNSGKTMVCHDFACVGVDFPTVPTEAPPRNRAKRDVWQALKINAARRAFRDYLAACPEPVGKAIQASIAQAFSSAVALGKEKSTETVGRWFAFPVDSDRMYIVN